MQAVSMKAVTEKERNRKKTHLIDVQFSTDKKRVTTQDRQTRQNSDEKQSCHYLILRFIVFTRFPAKQTAIAC